MGAITSRFFAEATAASSAQVAVAAAVPIFLTAAAASILLHTVVVVTQFYALGQRTRFCGCFTRRCSAVAGDADTMVLVATAVDNAACPSSSATAEALEWAVAGVVNAGFAPPHADTAAACSSSTLGNAS